MVNEINQYTLKLLVQVPGFGAKSCGEDSKTYNKLSIVYEYNIHHHIRNKLSLSINVILKPSEETNHLSLTSH